MDLGVLDEDSADSVCVIFEAFSCNKGNALKLIGDT
jgi:hypothetical protein